MTMFCVPLFVNCFRHPESPHNYTVYPTTKLRLRLAQFLDSKKNMTNAFEKEVLIGFDEDSVRKRKLRFKHTSVVRTQTRLHMISQNTIEKTVPDKKYEDYHGSTRNDMLTLVNLPILGSMWTLPVKMKHEVYAHVDGNRRTAYEATAQTTYNLSP